MTDAANSAEQRPASPPSFVLFTTPMSLCDLDQDSRQCPICMEPYIEPQNRCPVGEDGQEWAMRVDMSATEYGVIRCCRHIFGRRCLDEHINSGGAWANKCPLCRQRWWMHRPHALHRPSHPQEVIRRVRAGRVTRRSEGSSARQNNSSRRGFVSQVLETFAVQDGGERVDATVLEVEAALRRIYQGRQQRQRGSDPASNGEASSDV